MTRDISLEKLQDRGQFVGILLQTGSWLTWKMEKYDFVRIRFTTTDMALTFGKLE